jgi:hypothetical protein
MYGRNMRTNLAGLRETSDNDVVPEPDDWVLRTTARLRSIRKLASERESKLFDEGKALPYDHGIKTGMYVRVKTQGKQALGGIRYLPPTRVLGTTEHTVRITCGTAKDPRKTTAVHVRNVKISEDPGDPMQAQEVVASPKALVRPKEMSNSTTSEEDARRQADLRETRQLTQGHVDSGTRFTDIIEVIDARINKKSHVKEYLTKVSCPDLGEWSCWISLEKLTTPSGKPHSALVVWNTSSRGSRRIVTQGGPLVN